MYVTYLCDDIVNSNFNYKEVEAKEMGNNQLLLNTTIICWDTSRNTIPKSMVDEIIESCNDSKFYCSFDEEKVIDIIKEHKRNKINELKEFLEELENSNIQKECIS